MKNLFIDILLMAGQLIDTETGQLILLAATYTAVGFMAGAALT